MEVRAGYKLTEVGVIPEAWQSPSVGEVAEIKVGRDLIEERFSKVRDSSYPFPVYSNTVASEGLYGFYSISEYEGDSVTVVGRGVGLGTAFARTGGYGAIGRLLVIMPNYRVDSRFLTTYINQRVSIFVETGGIPQLTGIQFSKYKVALPPLPEQRAIASALSDVDGLLRGLDRLIAKKRDLKQAAMQQLLTGQTRLPGFHGEWEVKSLGEVCRVTTGKKDVNEGNPNGQFPFFTCSRSHTFSDSYSFDTEAILIAGNGEVGNLHYIGGKFEAYQRTYVLLAFSTNVRYLWQQLSMYLADSLGLGKIGSSIPYIKKENLVDFEFNSPRDSAEQSAIAEILADMDTELSTLELRREKTQALKQSMMQDLLTGRTRLL